MSELAGVARLEKLANARFEHITEAQSKSDHRLQERRALFSRNDFDDDAAVVLTGSWGRREVTSASDDDYMVLFVEEERKGACPTVEEAAAILNAKEPGRESIFAEQVWLDDLLSKIGRDRDTNANFTRRMLLVLESVAVSGMDIHMKARHTVLEGYLRANAKNYRPPRFLLNDLIRYWRTVAVDFESKMRARDGQGWGLRNAKLRLSRKALFAGGLLPVLECHRLSAGDMLDYLDERMAVPPIDRIADAFVAHNMLDPGVRALDAYSEFLGILDDPATRNDLDEIAMESSDQSPLFARVSELGKEFESSLLALLFDDPELRIWVRDYLIF